ncbi:MAG: hypothetical protein NUV74_05580 [Candidatus Brocadiaceae bacterium]|nr:hypothetical protein [Candidatus Brocadiaceae bacterium]
MTESFDKLKKQKEKIVAKQSYTAIEQAVTIGFDAFRLCLGIKPKEYDSNQIIRWIKLMGKASGQAKGNRG